MGGDVLISKSGAKCPGKQGRNSSRLECEGYNGAIPMTRPAKPEMTLNKSTSVEEFNAGHRVARVPSDGVTGSQLDV